MKKRILRIENGLINNISQVLFENIKAGNMLFITDETVDRKYGATIEKQLKNIGNFKKVYVNQNTISFAMKIAEDIIANDTECIVALGGGRVLDVAKYVAYICKIPILSIPTTAANDGIASPIAVLKNGDNRPKSLGSTVPDMLVIDVNIVCDCPKQLIKAGIGDTISNYMALKDWKLACNRHQEQMNGYAFILSQNSLDMLMNSQFTGICSDFIKVLINSLVMSGIAMDYAKSSRPVSGSEHLFSHALDYYSKTPALHGIQVALGTISMLKLLEEDYSGVLNYLNKFNVCINPRFLGIDRELFVTCINNAMSMRPNRYTILNEIDWDNSRINKIYDELLEEL